MALLQAKIIVLFSFRLMYVLSVCVLNLIDFAVLFSFRFNGLIAS